MASQQKLQTAKLEKLSWLADCWRGGAERRFPAAFLRFFFLSVSQSASQSPVHSTPRHAKLRRGTQDSELSSSTVHFDVGMVRLCVVCIANTNILWL